MLQVINATLNPATTDFTFNTPISMPSFKTATEIANYYNISVNKRGGISKIKNKIVDAGIESKNGAFLVRLVS